MSELQDVKVRSLLPWTAALVVLLALTLLGVRLFFNPYDVREGSRLKSLTESPFRLETEGMPALEASRRTELLQLRAHEASLLEHYGWVDERAGIVRIPIGRAIDLTLERGLPTEVTP